jgi:hypothetical protein
MLREKTNDKTLGDYFNRIAVSIVKEAGQKEAKYKLEDPTFMGPDFESENSQHLKSNVENFIERMEALVSTLVQSKKRGV